MDTLKSQKQFRQQNRFSAFRFIAASFLCALIFSAFSLLGLIQLSRSLGAQHRKEFIFSIGQIIENKPPEQAFSDLHLPGGRSLFKHDMHFPPPNGFMNSPDHRPPPLGFDAPPPGSVPPAGSLPGGQANSGGPAEDPGHMPPPPDHMGPPMGPPRNFPRPKMWIIAEDRSVKSSSQPLPFPESAKSVELPNEIHKINSNESWFNFKPTAFVMRLDEAPPVFLVLEDENNFFSGPLFYTQSIFTVVTVSASVLLAMLLTYFYLRFKSREAKAILLRLEQGDLKARFKIRRFDEFGSLTIDFNRMASEIERLVNHVHATETTRKNLLQELGHDLRTPLTSISMAFETFRKHFNKMTEDERVEIFELVETEIHYFKELLEKLMTIASLDEPHYKQTTEKIPLVPVLMQEVRTRQNAPSPTSLTWTCTTAGTQVDEAEILGDTHLIQRLLKNALDNAGRFAQSQVDIRVRTQDNFLVVDIADDGPGLTEAAIGSFGQRAETRQRVRNSTADLSKGFSIGLGSVIMNTIVNLHNGKIKIGNRKDKSRGALLTIHLPLVRS